MELVDTLDMVGAARGAATKEAEISRKGPACIPGLQRFAGKGYAKLCGRGAKAIGLVPSESVVCGSCWGTTRDALG